MRSKRRVGIVDLLAGEASPAGTNWIYHTLFRRQFYGVMPQVVAAWCRRHGHSVFYSTYYGQRAPELLVPDDIDVVFLSAFTEAAALAYALSKIFRARGVRTVLGGPHARAFPDHARHFFDIVVTECNESVVQDILADEYSPGSIASCGKIGFELPPLAERREDVDTASRVAGRYSRMSIVPLLSSTGCPYGCNFCVDANSKYRTRDSTALVEDLNYAARQMGNRTLAYYDPNFGVNFERTMSAIEAVPAGIRNPYIIESSLSILKPQRLARLKTSNCIYVAPGIESWGDYNQKAGTGKSTALEKYDKLVAQFDLISQFVPGLQANFMFGCDSDEGQLPVDLTVAFIRRFPNVFPGITFPIAFGGTALRSSLRGQGRLLPLSPMYYFHPFPTLRFKNYSINEFFDGLIKLFSAALTWRMIGRRLTVNQPVSLRAANILRSVDLVPYINTLQNYKKVLNENTAVRAFYDGVSDAIPAYYDAVLDRRLGRYAHILGSRERHFISVD
jgi:hypothetical protein